MIFNLNNFYLILDFFLLFLFGIEDDSLCFSLLFMLLLLYMHIPQHTTATINSTPLRVSPILNIVIPKKKLAIANNIYMPIASLLFIYCPLVYYISSSFSKLSIGGKSFKLSICSSFKNSPVVL